MAKNNFAEKIVKDIVFDVLLKRVISKIVARLPFFAIPIINPIFIFAVTKLLEFIYVEGEMHLAFAKIDVKVNNEVEEFARAKDEVLKNPKDEQKRKEFENAAIKLISLN